MQERRIENKFQAFHLEARRQMERSLLEVQQSEETETLVNGAMQYALLREAEQIANKQPVDEPSVTTRERFLQMLEEKLAQAGAN